MSILGTIRTRFAWLILVLIAVAIFAFMLMDGTSGKGGSLTGANKAVGYVNGQKIKAVDYQAKITQLQTLYPNATAEQIENTAWTELIEESAFKSRYNNLGLHVTKQELADLMKGSNPHPYARQQFSNLSADGQYDQFRAIEVVDDPASVPNGPEIVKQLEHSIKADVLNQKYNSLLRNGVNTPTWLAQTEFVKEYKTVDFDFVMLPYALIKDDEVPVTDEELMAYAKKEHKKYEAKDGYVLEYVPFPLVPSKADSTAQLIKVQELKERFQNFDKPMMFARDFSNSPTINEKINPRLQYQTSKTINFNEANKGKILSSSVGEIVGPFVEDGVIYMTKTVDKKNIADSAKVRHILISENFETPEGYTASKKLADSLATVLKKDKSKFDDFVVQYSVDPGSNKNGGVYDFFPQGQMVPEFNDVSFDGAIGSINVVETNYGFHIVEPLDRKGFSEGYELAVLGQRISPSQETRNTIYAQAEQFEQNSKTAEDFEKNGKEHGGAIITPNVPMSANTIPGIENTNEIVRWAIRSPVGTVKYFNNSSDQSFVVRIKQKTKQGEIDLETHRLALTNEVRNEKKSALLRKQIEEKGGAVQPLDEIASKFSRSVQKATDAKFGASGQTIGYEPELISSLFVLDKGQVDHPIDGRRGVYLVNITNFGTVPPQSDFTQYQTRMNNSMSQQANIFGIRNAMEQQGEIKDERYKLR